MAMAKRIQNFRNFNSSNEVAASNSKKVEVAKKPKKAVKVNPTEKEKKKVSRKLIVFFILLMMTGIVIGCLFSPTFNLEGFLVVSGNHVTREEILNSFSVEKNINVFKVNYKEIENAVSSIPYIKSAEARIEFPNRIKIEYIEREPFALIKYLESYMVMDKYGYILEIVRENKFEDLPVIYNIEFSSYEIGKQLEDTAKTKYDNVIYLLENAKQNEFSYTIAEINYESIRNVKIWVKEEDIEIIYGEIDRNFIMDKLSYIEEILRKTKGKKGRIDVSGSDYLEGKVVFTERI